MSVLEIPAQVWFLIAFGAVMVLLADTAVRSWRSPERVADPAFMWPRPAPVRSDVVIGPRLPGGSFRMPEQGLRLGWGPGGSFFQDIGHHPARHLLTTASPGLARPLVVVPDAGAAFWSQVEGGELVAYQNSGEVIDTTGPTVHEGASLDWSPLDEHAAATAARLPLDDVDEWLAERVRQFEHELSRIGCRTVSLVRGEPQRTVDDELDAFVSGSQQLHAYRVMRIGQTGEYRMVDAARVEALRVAA